MSKKSKNNKKKNIKNNIKKYINKIKKSKTKFTLSEIAVPITKINAAEKSKHGKWPDYSDILYKNIP